MPNALDTSCCWRYVTNKAKTNRYKVYDKDVVYRYGGEEFAVIFTKTSFNGVIEASERIRSAIEKTPIQLETSIAEFMTVSIGLAVFHKDYLIDSNLIKLADNRLLIAKAKGKNRLVYDSVYVCDNASLHQRIKMPEFIALYINRPYQLIEYHHQT